MTPHSIPQIIAHRGYSAKAPENTLAAIDAALATGVEAVEFDVRTAACGTPVLFHDQMLGRTTNGVGPLRRRPVGHLKALDAGSWFGADFAGETIPTLEETLQHLAGRVSLVYQEIKGYREMDDLDRMVDITRRTGTADDTIFLSSDWVILNRLRQVAPEIRRGYIAEDEERVSEALDRAAVDEGSLLSLEVGLATKNTDAVKEALEAGVEVGTWTVDQPEEALTAIELGITHITTNEVERLLYWRATLS